MKTDTQHSAPITRTQTSSDGEDASPPPLAGTPPVSSQPLPRGVRVPLPDTRGPAAVFLPRSTTRPPRPPHTTRAWGAQPPQVVCVRALHTRTRALRTRWGPPQLPAPRGGRPQRAPQASFSLGIARRPQKLSGPMRERSGLGRAGAAGSGATVGVGCRCCWREESAMTRAQREFRYRATGGGRARGPRTWRICARNLGPRPRRGTRGCPRPIGAGPSPSGG